MTGPIEGETSPMSPHTRKENRMNGFKPRRLGLSEGDLDFIVEEAAPEFKDKEKLKQLIREDEDFRKGLVGAEKVFQKVTTDEEGMVKVSPSLYFEILLRRSFKELQTATHTMERAGTLAIPVFDAKDVVDLLAKQPVLYYLADMLSSFTRSSDENQVFS